MRIGFLGLGTMGEPIANNLRKAGHDLTVWNRTRSKADHIVSKGGKLARTPRECAAGKDLVFTCVSDEKALDAVLDGTRGCARRPRRAGDTLVDLSTAGTRSARSVASRAAARGAAFVASPVLGSKPAAEQAQVVLVVGGPAAAREGAAGAPRRVVANHRARGSGPGGAREAVRERGGRRDDRRLRRGAGARRLGRRSRYRQIVEVLQASSFHSPLVPHEGGARRAAGLGIALRHRPRREGSAARAGGRRRAGREGANQRGGAPAPRRGGRERPRRQGHCRGRRPASSSGRRRSRGPEARGPNPISARGRLRRPS